MCPFSYTSTKHLYIHQAEVIGSPNVHSIQHSVYIILYIQSFSFSFFQATSIRQKLCTEIVSAVLYKNRYYMTEQCELQNCKKTTFSHVHWSLSSSQPGGRCDGPGLQPSASLVNLQWSITLQRIQCLPVKGTVSRDEECYKIKSILCMCAPMACRLFDWLVIVIVLLLKIATSITLHFPEVLIQI